MGSSSTLAELDNDVLDIVCGLLSESDKNSASLIPLSTTDKRTRVIAIRHLFKRLKLYFVGNQPWKRGSARLKTWNPKLAPFVKSVEMTFASAHHAFVNQTEEDLGAEEAVKQLAGVLSTLTKLRKIACSIHDPKHEQRLEKALRTRHVQPFALAEEAHGPSSHIFVRLCPNARYISNLDKASFSYGSEERARKLYDLLHLAPKLDSLEITSSWSTSTLQELRNAAPNVSRLLLNGGLLNRSLNIYSLIPVFASFPTLKILRVMSLSRLGVGYDPPRCGNSYMGSHGAQLRERLERQCHESTEKVATAVFDACKQLVELWLGSFTRALAERRGGTVINIKYDFKASQHESLGSRAPDF
ncbi:hypothetical protein CPB85DRAFT_1310476 [Mucidula mucida]|nr:hypothetical protein CPB85DRAFT_1310476 [Mucidula mucida]